MSGGERIGHCNQALEGAHLPVSDPSISLYHIEVNKKKRNELSNKHFIHELLKYKKTEKKAHFFVFKNSTL